MEARKLSLGLIVLGSIQMNSDTLTFLDGENVRWGDWILTFVKQVFICFH